jgi:hypothetical protein
VVESPEPSTSAASAGAVRPDTFARVATDDLRVRTKPGVGADSIKLEPLLWKDALVFVIDGPVAASGYDWYLVKPMGEADVQHHPDPPQDGWVVAAGKDGEPWLAPYSPNWCSPRPFDAPPSDFEWPPRDLLDLSCYGNATLRFPALLGRGEFVCEPAPPWRIEPSWLDWCEGPGYRLADPDLGEAPIGLGAYHVVFDPAVDLDKLPALDDGGADLVAVDVVGQYDHPAAADCRLEPRYPSSEPQPDQTLTTLGCRATFVVTAITPTSDP